MKFPPRKLLIGLLLLLDWPPLPPEDEEEDDDEGEFKLAIAFWIPCEANMPGLNSGLSVVEVGPKKDCIACRTRLDLGESDVDDEDDDDDKPEAAA